MKPRKSRIIVAKILCIAFCIPMYPLVLFAVWYDKRTSFGGKFNFRESTKDYWSDVKETIRYK